MQPQTVQHGRRPLHDTQDGNGQEKPDVEEYDGHDNSKHSREIERVAEGHGPEHDGELLVGEGEGPEAEVGCCVGDAVEAEF